MFVLNCDTAMAKGLCSASFLKFIADPLKQSENKTTKAICFALFQTEMGITHEYRFATQTL